MQSDNRLAQILENLYAHTGAEHAAEYAAQAMDYLARRTDSMQELSVRMLKGGTYKIKSYYMENNLLTDIRGASTLISEVQNSVLPQILRGMIGFDCILYNGGGNLCALVPSDIEPEIAQQLEQAADAHLVTAKTAYYLSEPISLTAFLGSEYSALTAQIENELAERKKLKLQFDPKPESEFVGHELSGRTLNAGILGTDQPIYCECCRCRLASYYRKNVALCGGCLHKVHVGETEKSVYLQRYSAVTGIGVRVPGSLRAISSGGVAVVYADGNNMGGIIQNIRSVDEMMRFSDFVKESMEQIVFQSLADCNISSLEIIALGGDDIFLLIPASGSVRFAITLAERYRNVFSQTFPFAKSTLSVGFCVMNPETPVKVALEVAEEELAAAKELVRENGGEGSISFRVFNTYEGAVTDRGTETLMPYSLSAAKKMLTFSDSLRNTDNMSTRLWNLNEIFRKADVPEEATLLMDFWNTAFAENNRICPPELDGYRYSGGYYTRIGNYRRGAVSYAWNDLLYFVNFGN